MYRPGALMPSLGDRSVNCSPGSRADTRVALGLACATALVAGAELDGLPRPESHPFSFFSPVVTLDSSERQRIDRGEVFVRILPARDGEVAVFAASRFDADPDALVRWTKAIEVLKRSPFVVSRIHRYSRTWMRSSSTMSISMAFAAARPETAA